MVSGGGNTHSEDGVVTKLLGGYWGCFGHVAGFVATEYVAYDVGLFRGEFGGGNDSVQAVGCVDIGY